MRRLIAVALSILTLSIGVYYAKVRKQDTLSESKDLLKDVRGVIVPHHDLVDSLIIETFEKIKLSNDYGTVIVIGPNHFFPESPTITSSYTLKNYPIKKSAIKKLDTSIDDFILDREKIENEHSVGIPIKYLSEIYPNASFVPVVVSPFYTDDTLEQAVQIITSGENDKTLYVLAVDFAHNAGIDEGLENNEESEEAIKSFDTEKILTFDDKHLDSPVATVLFLKIMQKIGAQNWTLLYSTHGSIIEGEPDLKGTSYLVGVFSD